MSRIISQIALAITTDAAGNGTATTAQPVSGYVVEFRIPNAGTAITATGGTSDWTLVTPTSAGTVFSISNINAPQQYFLGRSLVTSTGGTTAYSAGVGPVVQGGIPVDDYLKLTVAQGQFSKSGTVYLTVEGSAIR